MLVLEKFLFFIFFVLINLLVHEVHLWLLITKPLGKHFKRFDFQNFLTLAFPRKTSVNEFTTGTLVSVASILTHDRAESIKFKIRQSNCKS